MLARGFVVLWLCTFSLLSSAQTDIQRYGITQTDDLKVQLRLGGDGIRGGGQILLVFDMNDGRKRRFDLNRTREEWPGGATKIIEVNVIPPVLYRDIQRIGIEFHGSQGDFTQTQDDFDLAHLQVESRATSSTSPIVNGSRVTVFSREVNTRFEDDQTQWFGGVRPQVAVEGICAADSDCDDGRYCNGVERCAPSNANADPRGCLVGPLPCPAYQHCNESRQQCDVPCVDQDGDGFDAAYCGGNDCDDTDPNRYPGNVEVADAADHDEDCDLNTHGVFQAAAATQICDGRTQVVLVDARERFQRAQCPPNTVCVQQPNGAGICMNEPEGYQSPSPARLPSGPQAAPPSHTKDSAPLLRLPASGSRLVPTDGKDGARKDSSPKR